MAMAFSSSDIVMVMFSARLRGKAKQRNPRGGNLETLI
jgi:hypothetical protein